MTRTSCQTNARRGNCTSAADVRHGPKAKRSTWIALPRPPRSADRARSLARVSKKREYFKCRPETIGDFAPKLLKLGVWRRTANLEKAAIGGHLSDSMTHNL